MGLEIDSHGSIATRNSTRLVMKRGLHLFAVALLLSIFWLQTSSARSTSAEQAQRLEQHSRWLASQGIRYGRSWTPPGESSGWSMDCSNTARYLYKTIWGGTLPRTASDQYLFFRKHRKFRKAPANAAFLSKRLRPGDFLFWENTYKPKRKPPVTHVMVYIGKDASGTMWMAGAQGSRGVNVYRFNPKSKMGGYNWFLWFRREGKFIGYARP